MRVRILVLLFLGCYGSVDLTGQTLSLLNRPEERGTHKYEQEMFLETASYFDSLKTNKLLLQDSNLTTYIYQVTDRLLPGQRAITPWEVYIQKDLVPNASAFPDGSLLITTGLLLRFDTEAQLAFVLAHELAHYLFRHALRERLVLEQTNPFFKKKRALRGASFSREKEWDADAIALIFYADAGYPENQAAEALRRLPAEVNEEWIFKMFTLGRPRDSPFRSHPRTPERVARIVELSAEKTFSEAPAPNDYKAATKTVNQATRKIMIAGGGTGTNLNAKKARQVDSLFAQMSDEEKKGPFAWEMKLAQAEAWLNLLSLPKAVAAQEILQDDRVAAYRGQSTKQEENVYAIKFIFKKEKYESRLTEMKERLVQNIFSLRAYPALAHEADRLEGVLLYEQDDHPAALPLLKAYLNNENADIQKRYVRRLIREIEEELSDLKKKGKRKRRN